MERLLLVWSGVASISLEGVAGQGRELEGRSEDVACSRRSEWHGKSWQVRREQGSPIEHGFTLRRELCVLRWHCADGARARRINESCEAPRPELPSSGRPQVRAE